MKYYILKVDPKKRILFDPKESVDFQGNTASFIQYSYARIQSILNGINFDLSNEELIACNNLVKIIKKEIIKKDKTVKGFNLGTNIGKISGQSIMHCHFHLIPRREGDVENPQGGVRSVIPQKQHYKRKI